jgi:hypothetical protein
MSIFRHLRRSHRYSRVTLTLLLGLMSYMSALAPTQPAAATVDITDACAASDLFVFPASADTTVNSALPSTNAGAGILGVQDNTRQLITLIRFDLSGLAGREVVTASLRLVESPGATNSASNFTVQRVTGTWSEFQVNWSTQPAREAGFFGFFAGAPIAESASIAVDVSPSLVSGQSQVSLALVASNSANDSGFVNREDPSTNGPRLFVCAVRANAPTPTPTSSATPGPSPTATATRTPGPSPTATATRTPGPSPTAIRTPGPNPTATTTATRIPGPTSTPFPATFRKRSFLPILSQPFNNHGRCAALPVTPPQAVTQPPNEVFNMYVFSADRANYTVLLRGYTYPGNTPGTLLLYRVTENNCDGDGTRELALVSNAELRKGEDADLLFVGAFEPGQEYLLIVYTRGGTSNVPYTITIQ